MRLLSEPEVLRLLNAAPGVSISRGTFTQSVRPQMLIRGDAQQVGEGRRSTWIYDAARISEWADYAVVRAEYIRLGRWHSKRPWDCIECDAVAQGNLGEEVLAAMVAAGEVGA